MVPELDLLSPRFWTNLSISVWNKSPLLQLIDAQPLICNEGPLLLLLCCPVVGHHQSHPIACRISFLNPPFPHKISFVEITLYSYKHSAFRGFYINMGTLCSLPDKFPTEPVVLQTFGRSDQFHPYEMEVGSQAPWSIKDFIPCVHCPQPSREGLQPLTQSKALIPFIAWQVREKKPLSIHSEQVFQPLPS